MELDGNGLELQLCYYKTLVDSRLLELVIHGLQDQLASRAGLELHDLLRCIPIEETKVEQQTDQVIPLLLQGNLIIREHARAEQVIIVPMVGKDGVRGDNDTENEFSVIGPKVGFVEALPVNLHLIRMQLRTPNLIIKQMTLGSLSRSTVAILYVEGIAHPENVSRMEERLRGIDFDVVFDTSQLDQLITDNSLTPFPLFTTTERRDRVVYALMQGQVAVISEGSPSIVTGPSTLFDFSFRRRIIICLGRWGPFSIDSHLRRHFLPVCFGALRGIDDLSLRSGAEGTAWQADCVPAERAVPSLYRSHFS